MPPPPSRDTSILLKPKPIDQQTSRKRPSMGESSGYISTDSEWEKVSEGEEKSR